MAPVSKVKKGEKTRRKKNASSLKSVPSFGSLLQSALFGAFVGLLSAGILALAATLLCYRSNDPTAYLMPLALATLYLSAFLAGFAALKRHRTAVLPCALLSGLALSLFFLVLSFFWQGTAEPSFSPALAWVLRILTLPAAALGGFCGRERQKKRRHS